MTRLHWSAALVLPLLLLAAPAHAERWSGHDPAGDVEGWHYDPEPEPCGTFTDINGSDRANEDITRLSARHSRSALRVVIGFRDLDEAAEQFVSIHIAGPSRAWDLDLDRLASRKGGFRVWTFLSKAVVEPPEDELGECGDWLVGSSGKSCKIDHALDFGSDTITVRMPRSCIGNPESVRIGVRTTAWPESDNATFSSFSDQWGEHAEGESTWDPPLSPELHAPGL